MGECKGKIAVLTSGGDAPGMNAAVRAVRVLQRVMRYMESVEDITDY